MNHDRLPTRFQPRVLGFTAKEVTLFSDHAHKGPNLSGLDPESGALVRLFHPRQDQWDEHFERNGVIIVGRTAIGRATVGLLKMNAADRRRIREL